MSRRSDRRAAERAAHKTAKIRPPPRTSFSRAQIPAPAEQSRAAAVVPITPDLGASGLQPETTAPEPSAPLAPKFKSASPSQIAANRENAKLSTGPVTPKGKLAVSQNRRSHDLLGAFGMLPHERLSVLEDLVQSVHQEYNPQTDTERRLADSIVQHYWLMQRALRLQEALPQHTNEDFRLLVFIVLLVYVFRPPF
jgi:hypothetical protein